MRPLLLLFLAFLALSSESVPSFVSPRAFAAATGEIRPVSKQDKILAKAFREGASEFRATCSGKVIRKLSDDTIGSRHQRFIIRLSSGQTLLIVHNIDLSKRVKSLRLGNRIKIRGEYIWNHQGGLIHYTHRDPAGIQPSGWIRYKGKTYR